jgi:hypothetical protein
MRKCVDRVAGDTNCTQPKTIKELEKAIKADLECPTCGENEEGCDPRVGLSSEWVEERIGPAGPQCCLKVDDLDPKKSSVFAASCTACVLD